MYQNLDLSKRTLTLYCVGSTALFCLVFLCYVSFHKSLLFQGVDGAYMVSLYYSQRIWMLSGWELGANFLQGLGGNVMFPLNTLIDPGYVLGGVGGKLNYSIAHLVWGLILFFSTLLLSRTAKLDWYIALTASWLAPVMILLPHPFQFYRVASFTPQIATSMGVFSVLLSVIIVKRVHWTSSFFCFAALFLGSVYVLLAQPAGILLVAPSLFIAAVLRILSLRSISTKVREFSLFFSVAVLISAMGALLFIFGLFLNSGFKFFPQDFDFDRGSLIFTSTLFSGLGYATVPLALLGLVWLFRSSQSASSERAVLAGSSLLLVVAIFSSTLLRSTPGFNWISRLPSPVYFEFFLWPVYCIAIAFVLINLLRLLFHWINLKWSRNFQIIWLRSTSQSAMIPSSAIIAVLCLYLSGVMWIDSGKRSWTFSFPPPSSPIMDTLVERFAHQPSEVFRGRVATFTGMNISEPINWMGLHSYDGYFLRELGNDFRLSGLWINSIPTLAEYSPLISPRNYSLLRNLFVREGDRQIRNVMTLRRIDLEFLTLLGIQGLITDKRVDGLQLLASETSSVGDIYLYQLENVNLSGWSPNEVVPLPDLEEIVDYMNSDFDPHSQLIVEEDIADDLVDDEETFYSVDNSQLKVLKSGYEVTAKSRGQSILVLPIEYSSCFTLDNLDPDGSNVSIFPGDLALLSIKFNQNLNVRIHYHNGVFHSPRCRLKDYQDFKRLSESA